jgi:predicted acylesterase/phospholipase RssA
VSKHDAGKDVYACFQGGGAKGVAYVGALQSVEAEGYSIRGAAGSSAGAITAALVAARVPASELENCVERLLGCIRFNRAGLGLNVLTMGLLTNDPARLLESTLFRRDQFIDELESILRAGLQEDGHDLRSDQPVTFKDLPPDVELHIVTVLSLWDGEVRPFVFNSKSTPRCEIARAVAASCAIPGALPSEFFSLDRQNYLQSGYGLMLDGGIWANLPIFCFRDASYRSSAGLGALSSSERVFAFVLEPDEAPLSTRRLKSFAGIILTPFTLHWELMERAWWRLLNAIAAVILLVVGFRTAVDLYHYDGPPHGGVLTQTLVLIILSFVGLAIVISSVFVAVSGVVSLLFWATVQRTVVPSGRAMMQLATSVPDWLGASQADRVLRVPVDHRLTTLDFRTDPGLRADVIERAAKAVEELLRSEGPMITAPAPDPGFLSAGEAWEVSSIRAKRRR